MLNFARSVKLNNSYHVKILYWLFALLITFLIWSMNFYLDQYVRAIGIVMPSSNIHSIQSLDGGVLSEIYVSEGQIVNIDDKLLTIKSDRVQGEANEILMQIKHNKIISDRLKSEIANLPLSYTDISDDLQEFIDFQYMIYSQRIENNNKQLSVLNNKLDLALSQFNVYQELYSTGDISLVELQNTEEKLLNFENEINSLINDFKTRSIDEKSQIDRELVVLYEQYKQILNRLNDTLISSPIAGVVNTVDIKTKGSVINPGDQILSISPIDDDIFIELKIDPVDIGSLKEGLKVSVKFDTFDFPIYGSLSGQLIHISKDVVEELGPTGNKSFFYKAYVYLDVSQENNRISLDKIRHGMGANVDILTGKRTVLQYITKPILRGFGSSLGEK